MSSITGGFLYPEAVLLSGSSLAVASAAVIPFTVEADPSGRWNAGSYRITARGKEVWHVERAGTGYSSDDCIHAYVNGVRASTLNTSPMDGNGPTPLNIPVTTMLGSYVSLNAGDYLDFRNANASLQTFTSPRIIAKRIA